MQILMINLKDYLFIQIGKCITAKHVRMDIIGMKTSSSAENAQLRTVNFAHLLDTVILVMKDSLLNLTRLVVFHQLRTARFQLQSNHKDLSKITKKEDTNVQFVRQDSLSILRLLFVIIAQIHSQDV